MSWLPKTGCQTNSVMRYYSSLYTLVYEALLDSATSHYSVTTRMNLSASIIDMSLPSLLLPNTVLSKCQGVVYFLCTPTSQRWFIGQRGIHYKYCDKQYEAFISNNNWHVTVPKLDISCNKTVLMSRWSLSSSLFWRF